MCGAYFKEKVLDVSCPCPTMRHRKKLRLRDWLVQKINEGQYGLRWEGNPIDRTFRVPWKHGSRNGWSVEDAALFQAWAKYTRKYNEGRDVPDPRKWKTNFRCALNALPDIKEIRAKNCHREKDGYGLSCETDPTERVFRVPLWKHGSQHGWSVEEAALSQARATYAEKFKEKKDVPNPRKRKTNYRYARNALPNIKEIRAKNCHRGKNAFKILRH